MRFKLTDPRGLPLDRLGITTPGAVNTSFVAAVLPRGATQYLSYTTRVQSSPITGQSATQAAPDGSAGTFEQTGEGEYVYTFYTRAPQGFDRSATHTIGMYASRSLAEFDLGTQYADAVFHFVPDGAPLSSVRDVVRTENCNRCHDPLEAHGGARRSVELCVLCHTPQTVDPDTGNTVDFPVMVHKIHRGATLPSVKSGRPYKIIGFQQRESDYSTVVFPPDTRSCAVCHEPRPDGTGSAAAAQKDNYLTKPSRAACGACHDDVNFATGEKHVNLPQISDNQCRTCHIAEGELEFDASIKGAHTVPRLAHGLPGTVFEILKVEDGVAGKNPTVTFTVKDKSGNPILASGMNLLTLVLAGPASDYSMTTNLDEDVRQAKGTPDGTYTWTLKKQIPVDAKGTYSIGIFGFRNVKLLEGTQKEQTVRDNGTNRIVHFSVDGSEVQPRRTVVSIEKCNACHMSLLAHSRFKPSDRVEQCLLCHLPTFTDKDAAFRPPDVTPQPLSFRVMIHKIHTGEDLTREYVTYGTTSKHDFGGVRYPGDRRNCEACHVGESEQLPLQENLLPVTDPRGFINPTPAATAACLSCHDGRDAASHALANISALGESCATCHKPAAEFSVNKVHAR